MKNNVLSYVLLIVVLLSACSKEGLQGPDGPKGDTGPAGAIGPAGKDGSVIYSGTGVPATTVGTTGDYYLDLASGNLYGPKTATGWGSSINLTGQAGATGATGATGAAGSQIYAGTSAPAVNTGADGDYYLDKNTEFLYGPKTVAGWGIPILLRGSQGPQGPVGPAGADGSIIFSGSGTPSTAVGKNGDYYIDKQTGALYGPKTNAGWGTPISLVGPAGATGATGAAGSQIYAGTGAPATGLGNNGDYYLDKDTYLFYGPKTMAGWGTPILLRGAQGPQGPVGPAGADGSIIYSGLGAPDANIGKGGDYYIDRRAVALYGPKNVDGWGQPLSLAGPAGAAGANGTTILSGNGAPAASLGNDGDFYLDKSTYFFYGPKTSGSWGNGTSLKSGGNSVPVTSFETGEATRLVWYQDGALGNTAPNPNYVLKQFKPAADSASAFRLPDSLAAAVNTGVVMVYLRLAGTLTTTNWVQLSYTRQSGFNNNQTYTYQSFVTADGGVYVRINCVAQNGSILDLLQVDRVRVVVVPRSAFGALGTVRPDKKIGGGIVINKTVSLR